MTPLSGLRVLELASGIAGPYAGRLLAMLGATVVKVEAEGGDPARRHPLDDRPLSGTSPLFLHLNAGKRNVDARAPIDQLLDWAELVIDDRVREQARGGPLDIRALERAGGPKVLASVTPWGYEGAPGQGIDDELLVQARAGAAVAGAAASERPLRFPGWQAQYMAGAYVAAGSLALFDARPGLRHLDVAWLTALVSGIEAGVAAALHLRGLSSAPPRAAIQVGVFPAGVFRCADGWVIPGSIRNVDWAAQCRAYGRPDLLGDERFSRRERFRHRDELREIIQPWYDAHKKREIFQIALESDWAFAMVMTAADTLADEHIGARGFLGAAEEAERAFVAPLAPWCSPVLEPGRPRVAVTGEDDRWFADAATRTEPASPALPSLSGVRVLELTRAWAGPFVGRFFAALGADVAKLEAGRSPDGWRTPMRWDRADVEVPPGQDPEAYTWDVAPNYNTINRSKRMLSVDATRPEARELLLGLAERADVIVVNMTARVLTDWNLEYDVLSKLNPRLVLVNMPALGASGPYRAMAGYGMLIEGMGGFASRFGPRDEQARATATYYPDAVAGIHATLGALSGLAYRARTGRGCPVDLSQQEALWLLLGESLVLASLEGRETGRMGSAEPGRSPSGIYRCADEGWLALVVRSDAEFARLVRIADGALDPVARWDAARRVAERDRVDQVVDQWTRTRSADELESALRGIDVGARAVASHRQLGEVREILDLDALEELEHPVTGLRRYLRVPLRIDGAPLTSLRPAPLFDQHTDEILRDWLALPDEAIERLRRENVVGTRPALRARS